MTHLEFKILVDDLFKDYIIRIEWSSEPNSYVLDKKDLIIHFNNFRFWLSKENPIDDFGGTLIYKSSQFDDYEQYLDELIIFKEIILPKYL
jgi:hypothetical protein